MNLDEPEESGAESEAKDWDQLPAGRNEIQTKCG
jgi:hypothetical protein